MKKLTLLERTVYGYTESSLRLHLAGWLFSWKYPKVSLDPLKLTTTELDDLWDLFYHELQIGATLPEYNADSDSGTLYEIDKHTICGHTFYSRVFDGRPDGLQDIRIFFYYDEVEELIEAVHIVPERFFTLDDNLRNLVLANAYYRVREAKA